jgi:hypothetical protein
MEIDSDLIGSKYDPCFSEPSLVEVNGDLPAPVFRFAIRDDLKGTGNLFLPTRAEPLSTGYDVRAAFPDRKDLVLKPFEYFKIPLGFRALPPQGWWFNLHPRSSSFAKKHLHNLIGVIDESFGLEVLWAGQFIIISQGYRGSCARGGIALLKLMQNNLSSCRFSPKLVIR